SDYYDPTTTQLYTLSLHDALPISTQRLAKMGFSERLKAAVKGSREMRAMLIRDPNKMISAAVLSSPKLTGPEIEAYSRMASLSRSEEHTSELQSLAYLVCRLLLEK